MNAILEKLKSNYSQFMECAKNNNVRLGTFHYVQFLYYYKRYVVSLNEYFSNRLYDKSISHKEYWKKNHRMIHKWRNVVSNFKPEAGFAWRAVHRLDYFVAKLLYPGLDAMDYFRYEFYNLRHGKRKSFVTEGYLRRMNKHFNNERKNMTEFRLLQDKAKFNAFFSDVVTRKWLQTQGMERAAFDRFCQGLDRAIAKPEDGSQGNGIFIASVSTEEERNALFDKLKRQNYLLEELVVQCDELARLYPNAVNSIRVNSVLKEDRVIVTAATLRLGNGNSHTDNYSAGGLAASVDVATGIVISRAVSQSGENTYVHPTTGQVIIGTKIPHWEEAVEMVKKSHKKIPKLRYIGWDVVVCADGRVTFLEANTFSGVELQQHPLQKGVKPIYAALMD